VLTSQISEGSIASVDLVAMAVKARRLGLGLAVVRAASSSRASADLEELAELENDLLAGSCSRT
jgi:hypothetical protein